VVRDSDVMLTTLHQRTKPDMASNLPSLFVAVSLKQLDEFVT
jgi:hypothetical protein